MFVFESFCSPAHCLYLPPLHSNPAFLLCRQKCYLNGGFMLMALQTKNQIPSERRINNERTNRMWNGKRRTHKCIINKLTVSSMLRVHVCQMNVAAIASATERIIEKKESGERWVALERRKTCELPQQMINFKSWNEIYIFSGSDTGWRCLLFICTATK